jgi:phage-related baseplate assembly protein
MKVKRGNYKRFAITIKDTAGDVLTDLLTADSILFLVKGSKTADDADAVITITDTDMDADQLALGIADFTLSSSDTDIAPGSYFAGLQINYSTTEKIEIDLYEGGKGTTSFTVTQDIVRG